MADSPLINGHKYSWASIGIAIDGVDTPNFTEITYKAMLELGKVRGMGTRVLGTTSGEADAEGSFTMLKSEASKFIKALGDGLMHRTFAMTVNYDEDGEGQIVTDELFGCRITSIEDAPKVGTDAATTKFELHILRLKMNGVDPHGAEDFI